MPSPFPTQDAAALCRLEQYATLRVSGADAQSFLQNLLSNDIREADGAHAQYSSFNSAKGRMLAHFLIWQDGGDYLLQLPGSLAQSLRKKLSMYVLRAKVTVTDSGLSSFGLIGAGAEQLLPDACKDLPKMGCAKFDQYLAIRLDDARYLISAAQTPDIHAENADGQYWHLLHLRAGIPDVFLQTQEQFVPQMVNLDLTGGVNFKKGCYPGQEIVARMHYLGKPKRRMYLAHVASTAAPAPGDELYSQSMQEQSCGTIVNAAIAPDGGYDVLAVVQIESRTAGPVHMGSMQGPELSFGELPYAIP